MTREDFCDAAFNELQRIEREEASVELVAGDILGGKVEYQTSDGWEDRGL